ncbi:LacI family transcriptional regulator [Paenibacillus sp. FSL H8-0548]|uniref:ABC transporter substrate-binding protein n=1 Tax=Paenibacillus sp. FSL H8-0548 TaxID=1920422 RepID=UPI00096BD5CF|nr:ABC transporter substrate-binding protein [Paenibacillus sp. FSL H8-0548]OMF33782.1 LacI family transcriptional regulator [Paenibacillus sp. FSL H8-0548]
MRQKRSKLTAAAIALILMVLLLQGCTAEEVPEVIIHSPVSEEAEQTSEAYPPARPIVLGFSQVGSESDWRKANTASIIEAAEEAGIELLFENAEQSQAKQIEAIQSFIDKQVDVIALAPVVHSGWEDILKAAKHAGIPVIISDRSVDVTDSSLFVTHIGSNFYEEGRKAGKYLLDKMSKTEGEIGIVELRGTEGSSPSIQRGQGFADSIKEHTQIRVLRSESANFTYEQGKETMRAFLRNQGSDIKVLFSHNDDMALGAIEAIEEYGLKPGIDIVIISVDGTRKAFEKLAEGKINCVVECNPLLGPNLMQAVQEIIAGRTLPKHIFPSESVFTQQMAEKEVANRKY